MERLLSDPGIHAGQPDIRSLDGPQRERDIGGCECDAGSLARPEAYRIRIAAEDEIPGLTRFGAEWWTSDGLDAEPFNHECFVHHLFVHFNLGTILVLERAGTIDGFISVLLGPNPFTGTLSATKGFWYTTPEASGYGLALLREAERWAALAGAKHFECAVPKQRTAQLLQKRGYLARDWAFRKIL
jgi:hypothetical protein